MVKNIVMSGSLVSNVFLAAIVYFFMIGKLTFGTAATVDYVTALEPMVKPVVLSRK